MISKFEIDDTLSKYDKNNISIATLVRIPLYKFFMALEKKD
jgi:hypothetical protein